MLIDNTSIEDLLSRAPVFREWSTHFYWAPLALDDRGGDGALPTVYCRKVHYLHMNATLSHLITFPRLTSIDLVRVTVNAEGQCTIYSLPHLRSITLRVSQFQSTTRQMPGHQVTHLRLFNIGSPFAFTHVLRQVAGSLTDLEVYSKDSGMFISDLVRCPLLRSITLEVGGQESIADTALQFLDLHPEITDITFNCNTFMRIPQSLLPNLRRVEGRIFPRSWLESRPIESFSHHVKECISWRVPFSPLWNNLECFRKAPRRNTVKELRVIFGYDRHALSWISTSVGKTLQYLQMWVEKNPSLPMYPTNPYDFLLGAWTVPDPASQEPPAFPRVKQVLLSFRRHDAHKFPLDTSQQVLDQVLLPICPVLEQVEFHAISSYEGIKREMPQVGWWVRYWKDALGHWNCRNYGAY